ncbi:MULTISPECIES: helix-turn-helix domain-containing protein [unclassified Colwellia]|jgi:transcriptional regulator with XRE-family HTH domain|uniref:helix-turn-helix domain-containing protein n=1 Tax=unclassified Colwellia TaxID=196834 RepID=UPI0015F4568C|nr:MULTISPECIES: helix-turn-helix transcriptional regulator [unclassified Colwellia]MBA6362266.1 helix-turn-helix transcriptional regulator [Colwellia sp. BRX8-8]MBA6336893.1 helix-turn-helix transcriptional regulator [Colwellia sp. BRX8-7]MBA6348237.1 helix-turn-helix transcriptional regulator [Colwellia sp. BRX8-9]MBA6370829.1 helix-turn-helix transcriptional regulator [Colwellia sp. BRX8-4]MBA6379520.1 helix-turn-helix transcriptional regulator [Colwellia sp. BRX10-7]
MDVNAKKIKELRTANGWTQQHLADACAISLRTVQRVERYGNASQDTVLGLASVFEIAQTEIVLLEALDEAFSDEEDNSFNPNMQILFAALFGAMAGALIMFFVK